MWLKQSVLFITLAVQPRSKNPKSRPVVFLLNSSSIQHLISIPTVSTVIPICIISCLGNKFLMASFWLHFRLLVEGFPTSHNLVFLNLRVHYINLSLWSVVFPYIFWIIYCILGTRESTLHALFNPYKISITYLLILSWYYR